MDEEQRVSKLEELLIAEFRDSIRLSVAERRELEKELVKLRLDYEKSKSRRAGERAMLAGVGGLIGGLVATAVKVLEMAK